MWASRSEAGAVRVGAGRVAASEAKAAEQAEPRFGTQEKNTAGVAGWGVSEWAIVVKQRLSEAPQRVA